MNARAGEPRGVGTMRKVVTTALLIAALSPGTPARASAPDVYRVGPGDVVQVTVYAGGEKQDDYSATITAGGTMVTRVTLGAVHPETTAVSLMQAFTLNAQALPQGVGIDEDVAGQNTAEMDGGKAPPYTDGFGERLQRHALDGLL